MEPEIIQDDYYRVETTEGTWFVPVSVSGYVKTNNGLRDYVQGEIQSRELIRDGYVCRMSMPGYLDCTEWTGFATEEECKEHLRDMYDCEFDDDGIDDEINRRDMRNSAD